MAGGVALLVPGDTYSVERPLLHFAGAIFERHGWAIEQVRWPEKPPPRDGQEFAAWFAQLRSFVLTHVPPLPAGKVALVGKSMGAFAAVVAADRGLPGIWLTPVLRDSELPDDLRRCSAPFLLVGSAADPSWDSAVAHSFGRPVFEAPDADHAMEIPVDPVRSVALLREVTAAIDAFVREL
jgi:hypothetical protein